MSDYEYELEPNADTHEVAKQAEYEKEKACHSYLAVKVPTTEYVASQALRRRLTITRYINSRVALVTVGDPDKQFFIHEKLLIAHSTVFKDKLRKSLNDGIINQIDLKDEKPAAFAIVAAWLYNKYIPVPAPILGEIENHGVGRKSFLNLISAWQLSVNLDIEECSNSIMDAVRDHVAKSDPHTLLHAEVMMFVDDMNLSGEAPLRKFLVKRFVEEFKGSSKGWKDAQQNLKLSQEYQKMFRRGGDLVGDIVADLYLFGMTRHESSLGSLETCRYHVHDKGPYCRAAIETQNEDSKSIGGRSKGACQSQPLQTTSDTDNISMWQASVTHFQNISTSTGSGDAKVLTPEGGSTDTSGIESATSDTSRPHDKALNGSPQSATQHVPGHDQSDLYSKKQIEIEQKLNRREQEPFIQDGINLNQNGRVPVCGYCHKVGHHIFNCNNPSFNFGVYK